MKNGLRSKIITESVWLFTLLLLSALAEYAIIILFDLHPVLSVKIQGLIGLLIVGYGIRMVARLWNLYSDQEVDQKDKVESEID